MTLLIKNVQIVGAPRGGEGTSDVFVSDKKISAIGNFANKKADVVIDGQGAYLSAGFIDADTASDHYLTLFDDRGQEDALRQGVTSLMGGMCGASLAPLLYGTLESLQKWGTADRINVNWHTTAEFLSVMDKRTAAVNFGTLVGHGTVRRAIVGEALRELTKNELGVFVRTLETALQEGAFGLSTGLGYVHERKTPYSELKTLAETVKKYDGVYATHLRHEGHGVKEAVEDTIRLAKETGVSVFINHFSPVTGAEKEYEEALALIEALSPGVDLQFGISPSMSSLAPIYTFLPEWVQTGGLSVMEANINDEWLVPRIVKEMPVLREHDLVIAHAPGNEILVGRTIAEIRDMYEVDDPRDALLRLMQALRLRASVLYRNLDPKLIARAIASPRSIIASSAPSVLGATPSEKHFKSDRITGTFLSYLSMIEKEAAMPLEEGIRKITEAPARKFGIEERGSVREGNFADLVCFRGNEVKFVVVNGRVVAKDGAVEEGFPGAMLRRARKRHS